MYNRNAKWIGRRSWSGKHKAAGLDGMSADLVCLLVEDSSDAPTPFLSILTELINIALKIGETPLSWRKAIISMIPKQKEDGSSSKEVRVTRVRKDPSFLQCDLERFYCNIQK